MRTVWLVAISFFFMQSGYGQSKNDSIANSQRNLHFGIFYSTNYDNRKSHSEIVGTNIIRSQSIDNLAYKSSQEIASCGYSFGFLSEMKVRKCFLVSVGFSFEKMGYKTKQIDTVFGLYTDGGPYQYYEIWHNMSIKYDYKFVSMPVLVGYYFKHKKFIYSSSIGVSLDYFLNYKRSYQFANSNTSFWLPTDGGNSLSDELKFDPLSLSFIWKSGLGIDLRNGDFLFFEPTVKYGFTRLGYKSTATNISTIQEYWTSGERFREPNLYSIGLGFKLMF